MAAELIERWRLATLQVRLDLAGRSPRVRVELSGFLDDRRVVMGRWSFKLEDFGLAHTIVAPTSLTVPPSLPRLVARWLDGHEVETALWLRLVPPYGYLGAVPWEAAFADVVPFPMLRMPNRLPAGVDPGRTWTAAVAVDAAPGSTWAAPYLESLLAGISARISTGVEVHVFADAGTYRQLELTAAHVHVHSPDMAGHAARRTSRTGAPPGAGRAWGDWIVAGLAGRAVRALHVVTDASVDVDRPMLAISPDPNAPVDRSRCGYVSADAVQSLADTIGATALSFGSPPGNPSDIATRLMADGLGVRRQGSTLYSSIEHDPRGEALAAAHALLAGPPGTVAVPSARSFFAHLQPLQVLTPTQWSVPEPVVDPPGEPDRASVIGSYFQDADEVPSWLASSVRFIDTKVAGIVAETARGDEPFTAAESVGRPSSVVFGSPLPEYGAPPTVGDAYTAGTVTALGELNAMIVRHARPS